MSIELIIRILIGIAIGIACKFVCDKIEEILLKKRGLERTEKKSEMIISLLVMVIVGGVIMARFSSVSTIAYFFVLTMICKMVAIIDLQHRIIPNELLIVMLISKLAVGIPGALGVTGFPKANMILAVTGLIVGLIVFIIPGIAGKAVGMGDVKFAACVGFCMELQGLLYTVVLMGACVVAYTLIQTNKTIRNMMYEMIPMGPFIAVSMVAIMLIF
jgi:prepilin signal peptidase PulO-like enzyme (type II secretory pathway)